MIIGRRTSTGPIAMEAERKIGSRSPAWICTWFKIGEPSSRPVTIARNLTMAMLSASTIPCQVITPLSWIGWPLLAQREPGTYWMPAGSESVSLTVPDTADVFLSLMVYVTTSPGYALSVLASLVDSVRSSALRTVLADRYTGCVCSLVIWTVLVMTRPSEASESDWTAKPKAFS